MIYVKKYIDESLLKVYEISKNKSLKNDEIFLECELFLLDLLKIFNSQIEKNDIANEIDEYFFFLLKNIKVISKNKIDFSYYLELQSKFSPLKLSRILCIFASNIRSILRGTYDHSYLERYHASALRSLQSKTNRDLLLNLEKGLFENSIDVFLENEKIDIAVFSKKQLANILFDNNSYLMLTPTHDNSAKNAMEKCVSFSEQIASLKNHEKKLLHAVSKPRLFFGDKDLNNLGQSKSLAQMDGLPSNLLPILKKKSVLPYKKETASDNTVRGKKEKKLVLPKIMQNKNRFFKNKKRSENPIKISCIQAKKNVKTIC